MVMRFVRVFRISGQIKSILDKIVPTCYTIIIQKRYDKIQVVKGGTFYVRENAEGILRISSTVHPLISSVRR